MKILKSSRKILKPLLSLFIAFILGFFIRHLDFIWQPTKKEIYRLLLLNDKKWPSDATLIETISKLDGNIQQSYFIKSSQKHPSPLIVSLHHWNGSYKTYDPISYLAIKKNVNYVHPNFRGSNNHPNSCCSDNVISDIDDVIDFAIENTNVDLDAIYVVGVSGGGYTALCYYLKSSHRIAKVSAWASISDLEAWHNESVVRKNSFANDILECTGIGKHSNKPNVDLIRKRSPIHQYFDIDKIKNTQLELYSGVYDGISGSVPFMHSINFYNKVLSEMNVNNDSIYVTNQEKLELINSPINKLVIDTIQGRRVFLRKKHKNISLTIFEGGHEILNEYALERLLAN